MQGVAANVIVVDLCGGDELGVGGGGEEGVGEVTEEMLEEGGDGSNVVVEGGRVAEVDLGGVCMDVSLRRSGRERRLTVIKQRLHLHDMRSRAGSAVDAFCVKAKEVDCLDTLVDYTRDGSAFALEKLFKRDTEHWFEGWEVLSLGVLPPLVRG